MRTFQDTKKLDGKEESVIILLSLDRDLEL